MDRKIYFSGLDGLRFIAIAFVTLHHFFTFRDYYDNTTIDIPVIGRIGYYGIQFFFAGSGFLITYLLLTEQRKFGKISLGKFYTRRILRIWPAYYLLIILALFILNYIPFFNIPQITDVYMHGSYKQANLLYFLFMPHIAGIYYSTAPYIHPTYTIGIEEQFYFIWGLLFVFMFRNIKLIFIAMIVLIPTLCFLNNQFLNEYDQGHSFWHKYIVGIEMLRYFRFPTFAIGSLWAVAYFNKQKWVPIFNNRSVQIIIYFLIVVSIWFDIYLPFLKDEYIAMLMLCLLSCAMAKKSIINYEAPWLKYLGKISYGIYIFHILAIVIAIKIVKIIFVNIGSPAAITVSCILSLFMAIFFGWLSYVTIEKYFLNIKDRLRKV